MKKLFVTLLTLALALVVFGGAFAAYANETPDANLLSYGAMDDGFLELTVLNDEKAVYAYDPEWRVNENKPLAQVYQCIDENDNTFLGVKNATDVGVCFNLNATAAIEAGVYCFKATVWALTDGDVTYLRFRYDDYGTPQQYFFEVTSAKKEICFYFTSAPGSETGGFMRIMQSTNSAFGKVPFGVDDVSMTKVDPTTIPGGAPYLTPSSTSAGEQGNSYEVVNRNEAINLMGDIVFNANGNDPATVKAPVTPDTTPADTTPSTKPADTTPGTKPADTKPVTTPTTDAPATDDDGAAAVEEEGCASGIGSVTAVAMLTGLLCIPAVLRKKNEE